jgi:hypothetical protein
VRICDTYGEGYFYIPGTETCLRVGGYIRYDVRGGPLLDQEYTYVDEDGDTHTSETWNKLARFSLQVSTASETELGTLRTYAEVRFNYSNGGNDVGFVDLPGDGDVDVSDTGVSLNFGYIQLGGFRVGKDESFFTTFPGYAGGVIQDDTGVPYGPFDTNLMSYTYDAGNGFSAGISLEEGEDSDEVRDYVPHVVVGAKFAQAWGGITGVVAYDSNNEEFAGKVRVDVTASEQLSLFVMGGYKTNDGDFEDNGNDGTNYYGNWQGGDDDEYGGGDGFAVWAGATYALNEKTALNFQTSYDEGENFAAVANVAYELVPGFKITPEVVYADNFNDDDDDGDNGDNFGAVLRFQRSF